MAAVGRTHLAEHCIMAALCKCVFSMETATNRMQIATWAVASRLKRKSPTEAVERSLCGASSIDFGLGLNTTLLKVF